MLVSSLSLFFVLNMEIAQMAGCLTFCLLCMVAPMVLAMGRAMGIVVQTEESDGAQSSTTAASRYSAPFDVTDMDVDVGAD